MASETKKKIGEILLDYNLITEDQLAQGIEKQKITSKRLGEILTELGFVTEEKLSQALADQIGRLIPGTPPPVPSLIKTKKLGEILLDYSIPAEGRHAVPAWTMGHESSQSLLANPNPNV